MPCVTLALALVLQGPLTIGSVTARPGEIASGFLDVPAGVDSGTRIPITIVRGREAGPILALVAGTHGSEVAPIVALQRVRRELDAARLRGTVLMVHVANMPSFQRRTIYYSPIDGKNLNRVYPGRMDGTVSERIAATITREIITRADYLVDMHAGLGAATTSWSTRRARGTRAPRSTPRTPPSSWASPRSRRRAGNSASRRRSMSSRTCGR